MPEIHIREATLADIPRLAEIWSIAFDNDTFYDVIFPRRAEFRDDYRNMWTTRLRRRFLGLGERYLVAETDVEEANGRSRKEIVGWASWFRMGSSEAAQKVLQEREDILRALERKLYSLEETYIHPVLRAIRQYPGDRFEDAEALAEFNKTYLAYMENYWRGDTEEHWHLKMLAVDPKWQGNGAGKMLTQWGLERAQKEGIPAALESSDAGNPMYLKMGFVEIGKFVVPSEKYSFPIMLWRPKGEEDGEVS